MLTKRRDQRPICRITEGVHDDATPILESIRNIPRRDMCGHSTSHNNEAVSDTHVFIGFALPMW
jgi:hypothetical protein